MFEKNYMYAAKSQLDSYLQQIQDLRSLSATEREIADLYATSVFLYATTNFWADAVSGADFVVKKDGKRVSSDHPLQVLLNSQSDLLRRSEICRMMWGRNLIWKRRNLLRNQIYALRWINPLIYGVDSRSGGLQGFRVYANRNSDIPVRYIYPADAIYQHEIDFFDDYDGVAPAEVAFLQASGEVELATTALSWFRNSLFMGGIFQPAPEERQDAANVAGLTSLLRRLFQGARNAGRTLVQNSRWEYIQLQQDFDKVALSETYESIRQNVSIATNVPVEFVTTGQANYAEIKGKIQLWYQLRLLPVLGRYADIFTSQLASEWGDGYIIEADITPLTISDPLDQIEITERKVQAGIIDLYTAQLETGVKVPDTNLRGLYQVNGIPVPSQYLHTIWEYQLGSGSLSAQAQPMYDVTRLMGSGDTSTPDSGTALMLPDATQSFIPDGQYKELQNWQHVVSRKGADYTFEAHELPDKAVKFIQWGLSLDAPIEDVFASADSLLRDSLDDRYLVDSYHAVERAAIDGAIKSINDTKSKWVRAITPVMRELDSENITAPRAMLIMHNEIERFGRMGYLDGLISGGIADAQMTLQDFRALSGMMSRQKQHASRFISRALSDGIRDVNAKALEWFNGSIYPFFIEGQRNGKANPNEIWVMNPSKENCGSCKQLNNQVHRRSTWNAKSLYPNSNKLICGVGNQCGCERKETTEKARGRFLSARNIA